jgi:hypothetical protein
MVLFIEWLYESKIKKKTKFQMKRRTKTHKDTGQLSCHGIVQTQI